MHQDKSIFLLRILFIHRMWIAGLQVFLLLLLKSKTGNGFNGSCLEHTWPQRIARKKEKKLSEGGETEI